MRDPGEEGAEKVKQCLVNVVSTLKNMEERLNELDSGSGDGDCGTTLATGAAGR